MGGGCGDSQFRDPLLKKCEDCRTVCQQLRVPPKCTGYCDSARCKALPAHYFDALVKRCVNCTTICGRHPPACSQHCRIPPPPVPTQGIRLKVTPRAPDSGGPAAPPEPAVVLYSLLAVCMLLLLSSLSLALVALMRGRKGKAGRHGKAKSPVPPRQEFGFSVQQEKTAKAPPMTPACPAARLPSDDSLPTETCACSHCFPDLKALGHAADRPPAESVPFYQPPAFHGARTRDGGGGGPLWPGGGSRLLLTAGPKAQAGTAVG